MARIKRGLNKMKSRRKVMKLVRASALHAGVTTVAPTKRFCTHCHTRFAIVASASAISARSGLPVLTLRTS